MKARERLMKAKETDEGQGDMKAWERLMRVLERLMRASERLMKARGDWWGPGPGRLMKAKETDEGQGD